MYACLCVQCHVNLAYNEMQLGLGLGLGSELGLGLGSVCMRVYVCSVM